MRWRVLDSPIGPLGVAVAGDAVAAVSFRGVGGRLGDDRLLDDAARQLTEYLAGDRVDFDLPLADVGGSRFERAVWAAIAAIPYGQTRTYGQIAATVGEPDAARAVGVACNRNPLPLVVPCHRVVGAGNKLVGFGGGLPRKRFLLELEARVLLEAQFSGRWPPDR
ncbi:MAG TPA: methylated-DNA--[protein]-cysteine S-methyltransferase [Micromonosporaceae bacterium]